MRSQLSKDGWLFLLICCMHIARFNYSTKLFGVELLDFFNTDDITSHEVIFWDLDETMKKLQKQMILIKDRIGSESDASKASEGFRKHLLFRNEQFNSFFNKKGLIIMPLTNYSWSNDESMRDVLANMGLGFLVDKSIKLKPLTALGTLMFYKAKLEYLF